MNDRMHPSVELKLALEQIEKMKMCGNCKHFYDWTPTMQMCTFGKSRADRVLLYDDPKYQHTFDSQPCENWELFD